MRNNTHLDEEQLLRLADGEISARQARGMRRHIESCWQCRTALNELQSLVSECVRYRKNVLHHFLPSPPAPWGDIYAGFAKIDEAQTRVPRFVSFLRPLRPLLPWVPIAAAAALILFLLPLLRDTSSVQAAELLRKAVSASDSQPSRPARRLRIKTAKVDFIRTSRVQTSAPGLSLQPMFVAAKYDWKDPLSAKAFQTWRGTVGDKRDEVTQANGTYQLRTTSATNELADARLTLRAEDFQPLQERLEFRNREWVEISDAGEENSLPHTAAVPREPLRAGAPLPAEQLPQVIKAEELKVLAALHRIGADLGDPIEIAASGSQVEVSGVGISAQRQQQIRETLRPLSGVVVHFSDAASHAMPETDAGAPVTSGAASSGQFQSALEKQIGGRQRLEQFSSQVLDLSESMMARVYAMRKLAQRFPPNAEAALSADDVQLLKKLDREHASALLENVSQLQSKMTGVLAPMGAVVKAPSVQAQASWQSGAEAVFLTARRTEALLAALVGVTPDAADNPGLPSDVLSSLAELRATIAAFDTLFTDQPKSK